MKENGLTLQYASDVLKADREIVLEAVKNSGDALEWASDELKADKEIILEAVKKNGCSLQYASDELIADREIALTAIEKIILLVDGSYRRRNGYFSTTLTLQEHESKISDLWCEYYIPEKLLQNRMFMDLVHRFIEEIRTNER